MGAVRHVTRRGEHGRARAEPDAGRRVSLEVHRRFLRRFVPEGAQVLEVGAGPDCATAELAALGCRVVVTDRSPARLTAHERRLHGTPAQRCVIRREVLDLAAPIPYPAGAFDTVLAFRAPLPHTPDPAAAALRGLLRVAGPDGVLVASVPSLLGSFRHCPPHDAVVHAGPGCRRYRWSDVVTLVDAAGGTLLDGSASNWAGNWTGDADALARIEADPRRWQRFLDHEVAACAEPAPATAARTSCSPPGRHDLGGPMYPPIEPYDHGMLDVGDGNHVHWETCGNPDGKPALVVHGGPGSGCTPRAAAHLRSRALPGGAVRPARLRAQHPARE